MDVCAAATTAPPADVALMLLAILAAAAAALVVLLAPVARAALAARAAARDPAAAVQTALSAPRLTVAVTSLLVRTPGGGAVFRGAWGGAPVAVFVARRPAKTPPPRLLGAAAAHPNVVHLFAVRETDVPDADAPSGALLGVDGAPLSLRAALAAAGAALDGPATADAASTPQTETVAVYELCERGTLRDAVRAGRGTGPPSPADEPRRVATLLEVARGLARVHATGRPHGALCPANVHLAASDDDGRGWVAKLAPPFAALPVAGRGAKAPHADASAKQPHRPSLEADIYAFGVLAWEVLAGVDAGLTPPGAAPGDWPCCEAARALARACTAADPAARPTAPQLVRSLAALADRLRAITPVSELDYLFAALAPPPAAAAAAAAAPAPAVATEAKAAAPPPAAAVARRPFVEDIFFGLPTPH